MTQSPSVVNPSNNLFASLEWRLVGPHRGGRVVAVCGHPAQTHTFYFGACAGGVWKTTDAGLTWRNISDGYFNVSAIGAIALAPSDPNVIYVGTGEHTIRGNVSHGDGVYKSTDGGKTWANIGLRETRHIAKIRVHPSNPDWVYVAALGHVWGPNNERGVYRSRDGGKTWENILFKSERAGAVDLSLDANNPRLMYATFWEAQRYPYKLNSGGAASAIYKSVNGGDSWTEITRNPGLPKATLGKMGIVASPAKADRVFAIIEADDGAVFRSDDAGATWQRMSEQGELRGRPWYYMHIFADPVNADTVYVLDYGMWKSIDGGKSFEQGQTPHGDNHDLWIDPNNPRRMIEGNDGGACVSFNGGVTWSTLYNQPTAQLYHVFADQRQPYHLYASQQDNSAMRIPSLASRGAITMVDWIEPGGGESGYIAVHPDDPNIVIGGAIGSGSGNGRLTHYDCRTDQERVINVWPEATNMGVGAIDLKYRFQWTFPVFFSRWLGEKTETVSMTASVYSRSLYVAANHVFVSHDVGASWELLSGDLTRNDPDKLQPSGGPISKDNTGAECYCTIFALVESQHERGVMWAGTDDGLVHLSRDGGRNWTNITISPALLPEWALISIIEPSPHAAATAYVAATRYKLDDSRPYLFKTSDYGTTWTQITDGLPEGEFTRTIRADPVRPGLLYCGTETGVYVSFDDGARWQSLKTNLPVCPIYDLILKDGNLIAATHGRSIWILDDLSPLRQLQDEITAKDAYLLQPRDTAQWHMHRGWELGGKAPVNYRNVGTQQVAYEWRETPHGIRREHWLEAGANPPDGVIVHYWLKGVPEGDITLAFMDPAGNVLRRFSSKSQDAIKEEDRELRLTKLAGMNRFVWDMLLTKSIKLKEGKHGEYSLNGPRVPPGTYEVLLRLEGLGGLGGLESLESSEGLEGSKVQNVTNVTNLTNLPNLPNRPNLRQAFQLFKDPRIVTGDADLQAQFGFLVQLQKKVNQLHEAINQLRTVRKQAQAWVERADAAVAHAHLKSLIADLTQIEEALIQTKTEDPRMFPSRLNEPLGTLTEMVGQSDHAPTQQMHDVYTMLAQKIDAQFITLQRVLTDDMTVINQQLRTAGMLALI